MTCPDCEYHQDLNNELEADIARLQRENLEMKRPGIAVHHLQSACIAPFADALGSGLVACGACGHAGWVA